MNARWAELAGAYALDGLDGDEKAAFEAQLAQDAELRKLVDEHREAAAMLAAAVPEREPPAALRERMLARALQGRPAGSQASTGAGAQPSTRDTPQPPRSVPEAPQRGRTVSRAHWLVLAASVAGFVWVGVVNRSLREDTTSLTTEIEALRDSLAGAQTELGRLESLAQALTGSNVRLASLTGDVERSLWLVWNPDRDVLVVAATGLPPAAAGRTYQLWGLRGSEPPVSLGTFDTEADGSAVVALSPGVPSDFELSALTDEPAGGSPQPTTQPFLVGPWRAARE
jgi:anti-sigma-K factor RskA